MSFAECRVEFYRIMKLISQIAESYSAEHHVTFCRTRACILQNTGHIPENQCEMSIVEDEQVLVAIDRLLMLLIVYWKWKFVSNAKRTNKTFFTGV